MHQDGAHVDLYHTIYHESGAPSPGAIGHWKLYSLNQPPPFLFRLVLHVCRGYGWVRVLVKLTNSQLVDTQRIAGVSLQVELFEFDINFMYN